MSRHKRTSLVVFLLGTLSCLGCDQLTKEIARSHLAAAGAPTSLAFGTVSLSLVENPGAFMSFGATLPEAVRHALLQIGVPAVLLVLCIAFFRQPARATADLVGLALVVGGGVGNWLDRVLQDGSVTDFVRVAVGPLHTGVFNAADVAILVGVFMLLGSSWGRSSRSRTASAR